MACDLPLSYAFFILLIQEHKSCLAIPIQMFTSIRVICPLVQISPLLNEVEIQRLEVTHAASFFVILADNDEVNLSVEATFRIGRTSEKSGLSSKKTEWR